MTGRPLIQQRKQRPTEPKANSLHTVESLRRSCLDELFPASVAHARYSSRMIDRFHGKPKSGKIWGRCQRPWSKHVIITSSSLECNIRPSQADATFQRLCGGLNSQTSIPSLFSSFFALGHGYQNLARWSSRRNILFCVYVQVHGSKTTALLAQLLPTLPERNSTNEWLSRYCMPIVQTGIQSPRRWKSGFTCKLSYQQTAWYFSHNGV